MVYRLVFLLMHAAPRLHAQQAITDGPYVFYKHGKTYIKSVRVESGITQVLTDSLPENPGTRPTVQVRLDGHPEWDFEVTLKIHNTVPPSVFQGSKNTLIVSDIEGEFEPFRNLLLASKVIDEKYNWIFGRGQLIIAGDLFDRGRQVCQFLWLLYKLEDEAAANGGAVHVILGNHDIMNLNGDWRYVQPEYFKNAALIHEPNAALYARDTELGRWLRTKNTIEKIGSLLIMHGGMNSNINSVALPLDTINARCRPYYDVPRKMMPLAMQLFFGPEALFWYRGYFLAPRATTAQVDSTLMRYHCGHIIVGHDIIEHVKAYYDGKVIGVDVDWHEGIHEALLIEKKIFYRVDDKGSRTVLSK